MTRGDQLAWLLALAIGGMLPATGAPGQPCPDPSDVCGCLGAAGSFAVATEQLTSTGARAGGYSLGVDVDNAVCSGTASFRDTRVAASVLLLEATGRAGVCKQTRSCYRSSGQQYCETSDGLFVGGDLATGGGEVLGEAEVVGERVLDGSHERLEECGRAQSDLASASATLAALAPNQDLGDVVVVAAKPGGGGYSRGYGPGYGDETVQTISVGPGLQVIRAASVKLKSRKKRDCYNSSGYRYCETIVSSAVLEIALAPDTTAVVLNVAGKLLLSSYSQLRVTGGAAPVLVNLGAAKSKAKLGAGVVVGPPILAPGGSISAGAGAELANLAAPKVVLKGAKVTDSLLCGPPAPPPPPPPPQLCCAVEGFCVEAPSDDCLAFGGSPAAEGLVCLASGECGEPPPPPCCSNGAGACISLSSEVPDLLGVPIDQVCDVLAPSGFGAGPAGSVCDAESGACVAPELATSGACCEQDPSGLLPSCASGPALTSGSCSAGVLSADAICDASGFPTCRAP